MHDGRVEDRLRSVLRKEGDELTLNITAQELERRLALRRRARTGQRLRLIAAGIAVVAIGGIVVAGNGWLGMGPTVGATPSPSAATLPPTSGPSAESSAAGLSCTTLEPNPSDQPPSLVLGAVPGDSVGYGGALGAYHIGDRADGQAGSWTSVDPAGLERVPAVPPTERLVVLASHPDACLTGLVADALPMGQPGGDALRLADASVAPTRQIEFAKPPSGLWLVRVHATFAAKEGATAWSETFFRVDARNPSASLGAALGNLPLLNTPPGTVFVDEHTNAVEPSAATGLTESTVVGSVQPRAMYIVDIVCLGSSPIRWSIGQEGQLDFLTARDQACDGSPSESTVELGLPTKDLEVLVEGDPANAWRIRVATTAGAPSFIPPALRMVQTGNTEGSAGAAQGFARCVTTSKGSDQCAGEWFTLDGARPILMPAGSRLTFALQDGWEIAQARITAAATDQVRGNPLASEYSVAFVDSGGPTITVPVKLGRGTWIVRVALNATKDGETFGANYDLPLVIE